MRVSELGDLCRFIAKFPLQQHIVSKELKRGWFAVLETAGAGA